MLRDRDRSPATLAVDGVHAGDVDDPTPALLDHARQEGAAAVDGGVEVDVEHPVPVLLAHFAKRLAGADHSVVHHDVDGAEFREHGLCDMLEGRSEEHKSELQSLMRSSYAVFCLKQQKTTQQNHTR